MVVVMVYEAAAAVEEELGAGGVPPQCGEFNCVRLDPAGAYAATSSTDKCVRIFDFYSGEIVAQAAAHSEIVTGVTWLTLPTPPGKAPA